MSATNTHANANEQISIGEAMEILDIKGRQTIYNLIARGELHATKKKIGKGRGGQRVFLKRAEVEKLRDENETGAGETNPAPRSAPTNKTRPTSRARSAAK